MKRFTGYDKCPTGHSGKHNYADDGRFIRQQCTVCGRVYRRDKPKKKESWLGVFSPALPWRGES
jgi:hypothetical protein